MFLRCVYWQLHAAHRSAISKSEHPARKKENGLITVRDVDLLWFFTAYIGTWVQVSGFYSDQVTSLLLIVSCPTVRWHYVTRTASNATLTCQPKGSSCFLFFSIPSLPRGKSSAIKKKTPSAAQGNDIDPWKSWEVQVVWLWQNSGQSLIVFVFFSSSGGRCSTEENFFFFNPIY